MDVAQRIEQDLEAAFVRSAADDGPSGLYESMRYSVFPGGARVRPRLCLAVARACGDQSLVAAGAAATAIELLHCASLVHDDLPCFDDADTRRGKPSVHTAFGQPLAVLAGDALIILAFETLALRLALLPDRLIPLMRVIASSVGAPHGIIAGQAWECEPVLDIVQYQRAKTGALFAACTMAGAAAAGQEAGPWQQLGYAIGEAFQVADDIRDVTCSCSEVGKPTGRDAALARPSMVAELGLEGAKQRFESLIAKALAAIPACPGSEQLCVQITAVSRSLVTEIGALRAA
jgi:geranylgeranyl diphosphate synthase, type II